MGKLLCSILLAGFSWSVSANGDDWRVNQNEKVKKATQQQRMEAPSSSAIGGSRSGELEEEKSQDHELRRESKKQKFLYEYENKYRRGL